MRNIKDKRLFPGVLLIVGILFLLTGTTMAFFNYTRTGGANTIRTGRIYFNSSQSNTINLTNVFPIKSSDLSTDTDNHATVTITVQGDTLYSDGIEYLISVVDVNNVVNNKKIPFGVSVDVSNLGTSDVDYFDNRGGNTSIYKKLNNLGIENNKQLVVGYITSGAAGINGSIDITAYIDAEKMAISDTYPSQTYSGYYLNPEMSQQEVNTCVSYLPSTDYFSSLTLDENETIESYCTGSGTADGYTIVSDLNDGMYSESEIEYLEEHNIITYKNYSDATTNEWVNGRTVLTTREWNNLTNISFKIKVEANEGIWIEKLVLMDKIIQSVDTTKIINFGAPSDSTNGEGVYILPGTENDTNPIYYYRGAVTDNNVIFGGHCWQMVRTTDTGGIKMIYNGEATGGGSTCENTLHEDRIIGNSAFNSNYISMSDIGYMSNARYTADGGGVNWGAYFGTDVEYGDFDNDGTSEYRLVSAISGNNPDATHHYTCRSGGVTTCSNVWYYFYYNSNYSNSITLLNGEKIEDALYKMTGTADATVKARNSGYVLNQNDSIVKSEIESWFRENLTNEVHSAQENYSAYLEDTVFCNDRSFKMTTQNIFPTYQESGWNPNGGDLSKSLVFGSGSRAVNDWFSTTNVPILTCPNETDRFSVSSSVAHLNYPVGLLTADEITMAGAATNNFSTSIYYNNTYYLYTGGYYWAMSPMYYSHYMNVSRSYEFSVRDLGELSVDQVNESFGLRPVISLKPGIEYEQGDGTSLNPYIIKYN